MVKISFYKDITIVTYMRIFLVCNKNGKLELFILAKFKLFPCKLF